MGSATIKEINKEVSEAMRKRNLTFFVGAGVSKLSNIPKWAELVRKIDQKIGNRGKVKYTNEELLSIPQKYFYKISGDKKLFFETINEALELEGKEPNIIHELILLLRPISILTTNFDDLIERSASLNYLPYQLIATDSEVSSINGNPFILKVHGDLLHKNIVLMDEDYLNYSTSFKLIETLIKSIFATNTVIFIGYGLNDYNIKLILNWAKSLLKDKFKFPFFIYTDSKKLSDIDRIYHDSRGIRIIDYHDFANKDALYPERYKSILEHLYTLKETEDISTTNEEEFELLFEKLKPLNELNALRTIDVIKTLRPFLDPYKDYLSRNKTRSDIFKKYLELKNDVEFDKFDQGTKDKVNLVTNILKKARQDFYYNGKDIVKFNIELNESSEVRIISGDYNSIDEYVEKNFTNIYDNYRKAYYLAKLKKYDKSIRLFEEIAKQAYIEKNFSLFLLIQMNRQGIYRFSEYFLKPEKKDEEHIKILKKFFESKDNRIFIDLPYEAQQELKCLSDVGSLESIYKNAYKAFSESIDFENKTDRNTFFLGGNGHERIVNRIQENLYFYFDNGLLEEEFKEFVDAINVSMKSLLKKYGKQQKHQILIEGSINKVFSEFSSDIEFNEVDFFCFVNYWKSNDIVSIFRKNDIEEISFVKEDKVFKFVENFLSFCLNEKFIKKYPDLSLNNRQKLDSLLVLLRYVRLPIGLYEKVLKVLLSSIYFWVDMSDIVILIDHQLFKFENINEEIKSKISEKIHYYLDIELAALLKNEKLDLHSKSGLFYFDLSIYLSNDDYYLSNESSNCIIKILSFKEKSSLLRMIQLSRIFDKNALKHLTSVAYDFLKNEFDYEIFIELMAKEIEIGIFVENLKEYLRNYIESEKTRIISVSEDSDELRFDKLKTIGHYIFVGLLDKEQFIEFMGYNNLFDFFINPDIFDFKNFQILWLLRFTKYEKNIMSRNEILKTKIAKIIVESLKENKFDDDSVKELNKALVDYFV